MKNHYATLGVHRGAPIGEMRDAYYRLARIHHPDAGGDTHGAFPDISEAWNVLSRDGLRRKYDMALTMMHEVCAKCFGRGYTRQQESLTKVRHVGCAKCAGCGVLL